MFVSGMSARVRSSLSASSSSYICRGSRTATIKFLGSFLHSLVSLRSIASLPEPGADPLPPTDLVNDVCRVLSDHRSPHHDLETSLGPYSPQVSSSLVEQVLKRSKHLPFSSHRFFLWAKSIPGFQHNATSYRILIDILGSGKNFALLWDFLREMKDSHDITPEVFWLIFRAYSRANLPDDAVRAFRRMPEFGFQPRRDDFDKLLYVLCKRKHVRHAQEFSQRAEVELNIKPTAKSYSILIRGWGDIGETEEVRKVFDEMCRRGCELDVQACNSLIDALCKGGNVDEAYKFFQEMGSKGIDPDACTYSMFIWAYCESDDIHSVFRVLERMKRYNLIPNVYTYNRIIKKLCKSDKIREAYELLDEMIENGAAPDSWSYNAIMAYHCEHSEVNCALKLLSRMKEENCSPDRHSYNMVLKMLIRIGRFDRADDVWNNMGKWGFYPSVSTYSVMVHGLCQKRGKLEEACRYFELMIDEGIPPYSNSVELLRNRLLGHGMLDHIEVLAGKMERSSSCSVQEFASIMRSNKPRVKEIRQDSDYGASDFDSD